MMQLRQLEDSHFPSVPVGLSDKSFLLFLGYGNILIHVPIHIILGHRKISFEILSLTFVTCAILEWNIRWNSNIWFPIYDS
jgi:hypothetical protein